jgi:hypothetical protein
MLPEATPPARVPHLIPLGELMGWAAGRQRGAEARLQLLRVDPQAQNPTPATPSTSTNSSRRQKRRVERLRREGEKAEVTFRPEDSIILPLECNEDEPAEPVLGEGYVFPLGTFDSMLTGQGLVDKALSTAAELHAFASTHKRPPESHDACTNTDPASPHSDTGISAQPTVTSAASGPAALPPELFLNLRFPRDPPVHDTETSGEKPERNTVRGLFHDRIEWNVQYTGTDHLYCFRHYMKCYLMVLSLSPCLSGCTGSSVHKCDRSGGWGPATGVAIVPPSCGAGP